MTHFPRWQHDCTRDRQAARIFRDGERTALWFAGDLAVLQGIDLLAQANAAAPLYALACAVIAMPAGSTIDDTAAAGFGNSSLREIAAAMMAKAEGKI